MMGWSSGRATARGPGPNNHGLPSSGCYGGLDIADMDGDGRPDLLGGKGGWARAACTSTRTTSSYSLLATLGARAGFNDVAAVGSDIAATSDTTASSSGVPAATAGCCTARACPTAGAGAGWPSATSTMTAGRSSWPAGPSPNPLPPSLSASSGTWPPRDGRWAITTSRTPWNTTGWSCTTSTMTAGSMWSARDGPPPTVRASPFGSAGRWALRPLRRRRSHHRCGRLPWPTWIWMAGRTSPRGIRPAALWRGAAPAASPTSPTGCLSRRRRVIRLRSPMAT